MQYLKNYIAKQMLQTMLQVLVMHKVQILHLQIMMAQFMMQNTK